MTGAMYTDHGVSTQGAALRMEIIMVQTFSLASLKLKFTYAARYD